MQGQVRGESGMINSPAPGVSTMLLTTRNSPVPTFSFRADIVRRKLGEAIHTCIARERPALNTEQGGNYWDSPSLLSS